MKANFKVRWWCKGVEVEKKLGNKKEVEELVHRLHEAVALLGFTKECIKIEIIELP
jgi:hypothetical protein